VLERDRDNPFRREGETAGAIVLIEDATQARALRTAGIHRAGHLIAVCGEDGINAEVAVHARDLLADHRGAPLACLLHMADPRRCDLLGGQAIMQTEAPIRLEFFNIFERGARVLLASGPSPFGPGAGELLGDSAPHLVVIGIGRMGESLVVQAARLGRDKHGDSNRHRLRVTLIDRAAQAKSDVLGLRYRGLGEVCELIPREMDLEGPDFQRAAFLFDERGRCDVAHIYICLDDDISAVAAGLTLYHRLGDCKVPIVVRLVRESGLATLLRGEARTGFENLHALGILDQTCTPELLLTSTVERLARALHEEWLHHAAPDSPYRRPWQELTEAQRELTRGQADSIGKKLWLVGCDLRPLVDWNAEFFAFDRQEVELLAEMEHDRWMIDRIDEGWRWAPETDRETKRHRDLLPWRQLSDSDKAHRYGAKRLKAVGPGVVPEQEKQKDRDAINSLPSLLAKIGYEIYRMKGAIGVTGHRVLTDVERLNAGVDEALFRIEAAFPRRPMRVLSSLAEGADRLAVERALARHRARLVAVLPLPRCDYLADFTAPYSRQEFLRLIEQADPVVELPEIASRDEAYEAAGLYVLDHCDVLLALWDGRQAQGQGGTGAIVAEARRRCLPIAWVHAGNRRVETAEPSSLGPEPGTVTFENL
jgi:hypothetical protein